MTKTPRANNSKNPVQRMTETCLNPWRKCARTDIAVSILFKGKILPICNGCWDQIADSNRGLVWVGYFTLNLCFGVYILGVLLREGLTTVFASLMATPFAHLVSIGKQDQNQIKHDSCSFSIYYHIKEAKSLLWCARAKDEQDKEFFKDA